MNNRQANNNGRRRGRGGQRQQGGSPNQSSGNRIDNRARGNAAQLLEKYKNLAREAQMQGDRVNTEYYLQFADHYFRVLAETRSRFEEQNPGQTAHGRRPNTDIDGDDDDFEMDGNEADSGDEVEVRAEPRGNDGRNMDGRNMDGRNNDARGQDRYDRAPRRDAGRDRDRDTPRESQRETLRDGPREGQRETQRDAQRDGQREPRRDSQRTERRPAPAYQPDVAVNEMAAPVPAPANEDAAPQAAQPRRRGRPRRAESVIEDGPGIAAILPPSLGVEMGVEGEVVEVKPRRRRVKKDEGEPAAAE